MSEASAVPGSAPEGWKAAQALVRRVFERDVTGPGRESFVADDAAVVACGASEGSSLLRAQSVQTIITSPPYYGLRSYLPDDPPERQYPPQEGYNGGDTGGYYSGYTDRYTVDDAATDGRHRRSGEEPELGRERSPEQYVRALADILDELRPALRDDGTLWLVLGDSYGRGSRVSNPADGARGANKRAEDKESQQPGAKGRVPEREGQLLGIPWRVALELTRRGWLLRAAPPWVKGRPLPESVLSRPTTGHEQVFMFAKGAGAGQFGYYDASAVRRPTSLSVSDKKKLREGKERIGGKHKDIGIGLSHSQLAPHERKLAVSGATNIGRKRAVGDPELRAWRTSDIYREALAEELARTRSRAAEIERVLERGGMLTDESSGLPEAICVNPRSYSGAHHATYPPRLILDMIRACTTAVSESETADARSVVLDPFIGSGTTAEAARSLGRQCVGFDLDERNLALVRRRMAQDALF